MARATWTAAAAVAAAALAAAVAGCGSSSSGGTSSGTATSSKAQTLTVALTDDGCSPARLAARSGPTTFEISSGSSGKVTELELKNQDGIILAERENVVSGIKSSFSLNLQPGRYVLSCPNGDEEDNGVARRQRQGLVRRFPGGRQAPRRRDERLPRLHRAAVEPAARPDEAVQCGARERQPRPRQGALRADPLLLRDDRAGRRELRRPRPGDRRPGERRRKPRQVDRLPPDRAVPLGQGDDARDETLRRQAGGGRDDARQAGQDARRSSRRSSRTGPSSS